MALSPYLASFPVLDYGSLSCHYRVPNLFLRYDSTEAAFSSAESTRL